MVVTGSMDAVEEIEKAVGAPAGFFSALVKEDDWTFIIKLHALIEAALTHLLTVTSGAEALEKTFARLELSDSSTGKLAFARGWNLLEDRYRRFITSVSQVRNRMVHDIKNVGMTLEQYVAGMDSNQRDQFARAVSLDSDREIKLGNTSVALQKFAKENPKLAMWLGALDLLANIYLQKLHSEAQLTYKRIAESLANAALAKSLEGLTIKGHLNQPSGSDSDANGPGG